MIRFFLGVGTAVAVLMLVDGCGASRDAKRDQGNEIEVKPGTQAPLGVYERTLNPSDFDEDVAQVKETQPDSLKPVPDEVAGSDSVIVEEVATQGFRIQIYASKKIDDATAVRATAATQFPEDSVYVVYDPPVYRVRIGDFPTQVDASRRLPSVASQGYPDAWVVADRILLRKSSPRP
jgi:hypothetical protein